jgi:hypothetical protein
MAGIHSPAPYSAFPNFHTNASFHQTPDMRPQPARFRLDTGSLRGVFNQQIHGSKRSLRSVEDFTEFEQRTAYFNGDQTSAQRKGVHLPERHDQTSMMAQMQNMADFPPAPKLDPADGSTPAKQVNANRPANECSWAKDAAPNATSRSCRSWTTKSTI